MAQQEKKLWSNIADEDEEHSKSPQTNYAPYAQDTDVMEYKLQPTGEEIPKRESRYNQQPRQPKKPLLSADEMIEQIRAENHRFVFLHCFGVVGAEKEFAEAVGTQSKYANIIVRQNEDRDNSIDMKFDDKEEAIKFIKLAPSISLSGRTFRVKFGRNARRDDNNQRDNRNYRDNQEQHHFRENRDGDYKKREYKGENKFYQREGNEDNRQKRENPFTQKRTYDNRQEEKKEETNQEKVPIEPFKPKGFINTKKDAQISKPVSSTETAQEAIVCVNTNAKVLERQSKEEHHYTQHATHHDNPKNDEHHNHNATHSGKQVEHQANDALQAEVPAVKKETSNEAPQKKQEAHAQHKHSHKPQDKPIYVPKEEIEKNTTKATKAETKTVDSHHKKQEDEWTIVTKHKDTQKKDKPQGEKKEKQFTAKKDNTEAKKAVNQQKPQVVYERKQ